MTSFSKQMFNFWIITKYQSKDSSLNRDLNAQLTEHGTEEHHEEQVGTNKFWAFILCFLNHEPGHVTTLKKS